MYPILQHPILNIEKGEEVTFLYNGKPVKGKKGYTIAAALHQAGFPIHSHSVSNQPRSLACGIGKCGACEMMVDGKIRRICITPVDGVKEVQEIPKDFKSGVYTDGQKELKIYKTTVAIVGGGPAGLACREQLNKLGVSNILVDNNPKIGGQFNMQTHQFFFFEKEQKFGGMRGFDIAKNLAGGDMSNILSNTTVWDVLQGKRIALKNIQTQEISFLDAQYMVIATGAVPFSPCFENDDVPGVYTAAVFQKMMNQEHTLLGKNILTIGAGNIGYLTSYQAMQAGAHITAILEAMPHEGGFPVQANRLRRLGIPIMTSHTLLKAIPNEKGDGITGAIIAQCENFKPIPGTEKVIEGIDLINICTGLVPDNQLLTMGKSVFADKVFAAGDAVRIGEGTSAVLKGRQVAYEIAQDMGVRYNYEEYLDVSSQYIHSQQRPVRILEKPNLPDKERMMKKGFVQMDCLYGFACNPCSFACPQNAIKKSSTSSTPEIDYDKCIGCMECVSHCPGLAIFGYNIAQNKLFLPFEYDLEEGKEVFLVDNQGKKLGEGVIEKILKKENKTNVARVKSTTLQGIELTEVKGFIVKENYPKPLELKPLKQVEGRTYVCHCEDVKIEEILNVVGKRKYISIDELKHTCRIGMGPCRGKRCIPRVKQLLRTYGVEVVGETTPRGPLSNQVTLGDVYQSDKPQNVTIGTAQKVRKEKVQVLIAGGGTAGSGLFRYFSEAGMKPVMINFERGSSWRNIGGGRPAFSNPDIADIAKHNLEIFKDIQSKYDIHYHPTYYVNLVHDEATYKSLDASRAWSDAYMVDKKDFKKEISPLWNDKSDVYSSALITRECWQATPGRTINYIRGIGQSQGGTYMEDCQLIEVSRSGKEFIALILTHDKEYVEYTCDHFVNALGFNAEKYAKMLGIETGLYPVKHQAFITQRLPLLGVNGRALDMIIDRRHYKGFNAVYGQQFTHTGQIIGCASPANDFKEANMPLKFNSREFLEISSEIFGSWIPNLKGVSIQATWCGYYTEPRYIVDSELGLLVGLRGHGFMLGQYLAKLYVDSYLGKEVPSYVQKLKLSGGGLSENAFK